MLDESTPDSDVAWEDYCFEKHVKVVGSPLRPYPKTVFRVLIRRYQSNTQSSSMSAL